MAAHDAPDQESPGGLRAQRIKVLFVDDIADTALMFSSVIDAQNDMRSVGTLGSADNLIAEVKQREPDITVLDLTMPGRSPLEALRELSGAMPDSRTIIFSGYDDRGTIDAVAAAGAWGLVSKNGYPNDVLDAIRRVARGETCFAPLK